MLVLFNVWVSFELKHSGCTIGYYLPAYVQPSFLASEVIV